MANKQLKTSVVLDVRSAKTSLTQLEKKIKSVQATIEKQNKTINKLNTTTNKLNSTNSKLVSTTNKATNAINKQSNSMRNSSKNATLLTTKLKRLASAYLGVMGAKAALTTSDTITSAENRLNALNGGNTTATQNSLDKMYVASQNSRMRYGDMMANASKAMTLAPDAFQGNIDNAIRFQEIMAKSYTLGGASAAEQASSMYQLIQALGSGVLQGDELRSVREGAPRAANEIEKFAQKLYNTTDSLKDMASQGLITSDIVVAAMMEAGKGIDIAFEDMDMTFGQAFNKIQGIAIKSFEPVLQMLNDALNSEAGTAIINSIGWAIQFVAGVLRNVFTWIEKIYNYIKDNWETITDIIWTIATVMAIALIPKIIATIVGLAQTIYLYALYGIEALKAGVSAAAGWAMANWQMLLVLVVLAAIVIAIIWVADSFVDACGIVVGSLFWLWAWFKNIFIWMGNVAMGLWESIKAIGQNIGIAFYNCWESAKASFWGFIADCLQGLKNLEPAINAVAKAFGAEGFTLSGLIEDVSAKATKANQRELVDVSDAWAKGYDTFKYNDASAAYEEGYAIGAKFGQSISDKVSGLGEWINEKLGLDELSKYTNDPSNYGVNGAYSMPDDLAKTADNTGDMADSMKLAEEDLAYLRDLAEMEWKKEFTTATIQVDMSNYNTVNGDSDLDGIATRLADKLYEELHSVANGVYA